MVLSRFLRFGLGFVLNIAIIRHLGADNYGILGVSLAVTSIAVILVNLGLETPIRLAMLREPNSQRTILRKVILGRLKVVVPLALIAILAMVHYDGLKAQVLVICLIAAFLQPWFAIDLYLHANSRLNSSAAIATIAFCVSSAVRFWLLQTNAGVSAFAWAITGESIVTISLLGLLLLKSENQPSKQTDPLKFSFSNLLHENWAIVASSIIVIAYMRIDPLLLSYYQGNAAVGVYSASARIAEIWFIIPPILTTSMLAALNTTKYAGAELYEKAKTSFYRVHLQISLAASLVTILASSLFEQWIFQGKFEGLTWVMVIHALVIPVGFLGAARNTLLTIDGHQKYSLAAAVSGLISALALGPILAINFGALGSALNYLFAQTISSVFSSLFSKNTKGHIPSQWKAMKSLFRIEPFTSETNT